MSERNRQKKQRKAEPQPAVEAPDCPDWISQEAKDEWDRIVPILVEMKILTHADRVALTNYCVAYGRAVQAQQFIDSHGFSYSTETGYRKYPEVAILEKAQDQMRSFLQEFGLSPASRSRVAAHEPGNHEVPSDEKFFRGRARNGMKVVG